MNKIWLFGAAVCMVLALGSCKPKQSAYKAAYEQAKEKESTAPVEVVEQEEEVVESLLSQNPEPLRLPLVRKKSTPLKVRTPAV